MNAYSTLTDSPEIIFSGSVLIGYFLSGIIYLLLPAAAYCIMRKFGAARIYSAAVGGITYFLATKLCDLCTMVLFSAAPFIEKTVIAAELVPFFEETGRLLAMKYPLTDIRKTSHAVSFAIGYAGLACIIRGIQTLKIFIYGQKLNEKGLNVFLSGKTAEQAANITAQLQNYANRDLFSAFPDILNTVSGCIIHLALTLLIFKKAIGTGYQMRWLGLAILLHYASNCLTWAVSFSENYALPRLVGIGCSIGIAVLVYRLIDGKAVINDILYPIAEYETETAGEGI